MSAIKPKHYFMEHEQMDFETQILLGCCHCGAADAGEILAMEEGLRQSGDAVRQNVEWRMKPYLAKSYYHWFKKVRQYNVRDVIRQIQCPLFIADPDDEQFWPGQSQEVYDALVCPKILVRFTAEEGANWHCEPKARALYDQRMFDWLATAMPK